MCVVMTRPPPTSTRPDPLFPYPTPFRSSASSTRHPQPPDRPVLRLPATSGGKPVRHPSGRSPCRGLKLAPNDNPATRWSKSHERRSEEHTSELQTLMRISYAVFCLKKKNKHQQSQQNNHIHKSKRQ